MRADDTDGRPPDEPFEDLDDFDDDAFFAAWEAAERQAAEVLVAGLAEVTPVAVSGDEIAVAADRLREANARHDPAARWMLQAAGIDQPMDLDDQELLVRSVAATISMVDDPGLPPDEAAAIMTLELADWVGALLGLARRGPGAAADSTALVDYGAESEEVEGPALDVDERSVIEHGFLLVQPAWEVAGVVEDDLGDIRLTRLGAWLLPAAAVQAWTGEGLPEDAGPAPLGSLGLRLSASSDGGWRERISEPEPTEDDAEVAAAVRGLLASHGPLHEDELLDRLVTDGVIGVDERDEAADLVWDLPRLMPVRGGRLVHLPALAEGRVLTHRVTDLEAVEQRLTCLPDLALYLTFLPPLRVTGGEVTLRDWHDPTDAARDSSLFGPDGWLPGDLAPGDLVACRVENGLLTVTTIEEDNLDAEASERAAQHLRDTFDALAGTNVVGGPLDVPELLVEAVVRYPATFRRPIPPVGELLELSGLAHEFSAVVDPDARDEAVPYEWLEETYGLDQQAADAVGILGGSVRLFEREELQEVPADLADQLVEMLALEPGVAVALGDTQLGVVGAGTAGLERFVRVLRPHAHGRAAAAALHLIEARTAEAHGDALAGEEALRRAVQADPGCAPAHEDLAWYLEDRGDAAGALRHLRQAGIPNDDTQVERLTLRQASHRDVGRNDPCPCGSGAKFKKCCERTGGPLPDRAGWLLDKASAYLSRPLQRAELMPLVEARAGNATDQRRLVRAIGDGLLFDVALFEGEWLEDLLEERGPLLPADEHDLAASWIGTPRSLYEIVDITRGEGLELLDLRSGTRVSVRERRGSTQLELGEALFARVVPDGVGHQLTAGVVQIPIQHREALLSFLDTDPSAAEICAWMAALEAPPTLVTMEGEPTVLCSAEYRVAHPDLAAAALAGRYEADADGRVFVDWVEVDGQRWGRGTVEIAGDRLRIETSAESRLDRFKAVIEEVVDGAELLDESRRPAAELFAAMQHREVPPDDGMPTTGTEAFDDLPDEVREALLAEVRRREEAWVDESIPLFGGLTPRQALDDPTRRQQLLAFLDEMRGQESPGSMSTRRIRHLLGLELL